MELIQSDNKNCSLARYDFPVEQPKGKIILFHGLGSCIESMAFYVKHFNRLGFSVYGVDLLGHGASDGVRGHVGRRRQLYKDIAALIVSVKAQKGDVPIILFGCSIGGNIVFSYRHFCNDANVFLSVAFNPMLELLYSVDRIVLYFLPVINLLSPAMTLSHGLNVTQLYGEKDSGFRSPQNHSRISMGTFHDVLHAAEIMLTSKAKPVTPGLILASAGDVICNYKSAKKLAAESNKYVDFIELDENISHAVTDDKTVGQLISLVTDYIEPRLDTYTPVDRAADDLPVHDADV